jgi:hypothetical protein
MKNEIKDSRKKAIRNSSPDQEATIVKERQPYKFRDKGIRHVDIGNELPGRFYENRFDGAFIGD